MIIIIKISETLGTLGLSKYVDLHITLCSLAFTVRPPSGHDQKTRFYASESSLPITLIGAYIDYAEPLERSEEAYGAHLFWTGQSTALREHRGALLAREYACAVEDNDFTP